MDVKSTVNTTERLDASRNFIVRQAGVVSQGASDKGVGKVVFSRQLWYDMKAWLAIELPMHRFRVPGGDVGGVRGLAFFDDFKGLQAPVGRPFQAMRHDQCLGHLPPKLLERLAKRMLGIVHVQMVGVEGSDGGVGGVKVVKAAVKFICLHHVPLGLRRCDVVGAQFAVNPPQEGVASLSGLAKHGSQHAGRGGFSVGSGYGKGGVVGGDCAKDFCAFDELVAKAFEVLD
jgi:hypothetical protein